MENDQVIEEHGLKLFIDKKSYIFLAGTSLEYSGGLNGKGFVFNNPQRQDHLRVRHLLQRIAPPAPAGPTRTHRSSRC